MSRRLNNGKAYKKTKQEQYNMLIRRIGKFCCDGTVKDKRTINLFWNELKDNLNSLGPPTRNITEWKKVWNDCKRSRRRREHIRNALRSCQGESSDEYYNNDSAHDQNESNLVEDLISLQDSSSEQSLGSDFTPNESNSVYNGNTAENGSNHEQHKPQIDPEYDDNPIHFPIYNSNPNQPYERHEQRRFQSVNLPISYPETPGDLPPLQAAPTSTARTGDPNSLPELDHSSLLQHTLYTLQNQMDHQTKLLENMSRISSSMALLMERQVVAMEKQTEAVRRQAAATEHHTLVMNSFVDMIKDRMPKFSNNLNRTQNSPNNN